MIVFISQMSQMSQKIKFFAGLLALRDASNRRRDASKMSKIADFCGFCFCGPIRPARGAIFLSSFLWPDIILKFYFNFSTYTRTVQLTREKLKYYFKLAVAIFGRADLPRRGWNATEIFGRSTFDLRGIFGVFYTVLYFCQHIIFVLDICG